MIYYRQCKLQRGNGIKVAWIPEEFAHIKKYIKIKEEDKWVDGWQVVEVGIRQTEDHVLGHERDYVHQREVSDI